MKLTYETHGIHTYLVYHIEDEHSLDSFTFGMITNARIPGLCPALYTQMNETKLIRYNISSKISFRQFFSGKINRGRFLSVLSNFAAALLAAEEYMLDTDSIVFDPESLYVDVSTCEISLICLPALHKQTATHIPSFLKDILCSVDFDVTENCDYVALLLSALNNADVFSLPEFKKKVDALLFPATGAQDTVPPSPSSAPMAAPSCAVGAMFVSPYTLPNSSTAAPSSAPTLTSPPAPYPAAEQPSPALTVTNAHHEPIALPIWPPPPYDPDESDEEKKKGLHGLFRNKQQSRARRSGRDPKSDPSEQATKASVPASHKENTVAEPAYQSEESKKGLLTNIRIPLIASPTPGNAPKHDSNTNTKQLPKKRHTKPSANKDAQEHTSKGASSEHVQKRASKHSGGKQESKRGFNHSTDDSSIYLPYLINDSSQSLAPQTNAGSAITHMSSAAAAVQTRSESPATPMTPAPTAFSTPSIPFAASAPLSPSPLDPAVSSEWLLSDLLDSGETTLLDEDSYRLHTPYLIRVKSGEQITIDGPVFRIGKEKNYADYVVKDNSAVSRSHLNVISRNGEYFVMDTNSKNHSYVNDTMIPSNTEVKIVHGAKIRLANEEFEFRLY